MIYVTYYLLETGSYGINPSQLANEKNLYFEPSAWVQKTSTATQYLGYAANDLAVEDFADFKMKKISEPEALAFAQSAEPSAYYLPDGKITVDFFRPVIIGAALVK